MDYRILEDVIGYQFHDEQILLSALTHSSAVNERKTTSNQRLEFLGDAVLQLVISTYLYQQLPNDNEGILSKLRSLIVCTDSLFSAAEDIELNRFLILGKGEELSGGRNKKNIIADAYESLIGAIYLDGGYQESERFILTKLQALINTAMIGNLTYDYKTMLQEHVQARNIGELTYRLINVDGPEHEQSFHSAVLIDGKQYATAHGRNRKQSEQNAAEIALRHFKIID